MPTILVTGVNGFVGKHLVRELKARDCRVIGIGYSAVSPEIESLLSAYVSCDLTNPDEVAKLELENVNAVISLAGLVKSRGSFETDEAYKQANVDMLYLLGQRLVEIGSNARVIAVSTGLVYDTDEPMPHSESSRTTIDGAPYVTSKLLMEQACKELRANGLDCIITRPFNHSGPGQSGGYLIPDIHKKLIEFQQTNQPIPVSPKQTKRDYTDVRDVVKAYVDLAVAEELKFDIYNICTGKSRSVADILAIMQEVMGVKDLETRIDETFVRPNDPADLYGSYERLEGETGWHPTIPFEQTIKDFVSAAKPS